MFSSNILNNDIEFEFFSLEEFNDRVRFESLIDDIKDNWFILSKSSSEYILKNLESFGLLCSEKKFDNFLVCKIGNIDMFRSKMENFSENIEFYKNIDTTIAVSLF